MARRAMQAAGSALLCTGLLIATTVPAAGQTAGEVEQRGLELTLLDAVELVLRHNLQIRVDAYDQDIFEENIVAARAPFDTFFVLNAPGQFRRTSTPSSSVLGGADVLTDEILAGGFDLREQMYWGTQWNVNFSASRYVTNNEFSTVNPRYDTNMTVSVTQPLLRNLGTKVNRRGILVAQNDFSVSRELFRARVQETVFQVTQAYWSLVAAAGSVDVARESLDLAREQLDRTETMVRIGVMAQVETLQSEQAVADAELGVLGAEIALENAKDTLKQLLNVRAFEPEGWDTDVVPVDLPATDAPAIDVEASIAEALEKNPTIRTDRINLESRKIDLHAARNQLLPEVNLIGTYALNGLGGDRIFRSGFLGGGVVEVQQGDVGDSLEQLFSGEFRDWSVGVQVSLPIGNSFARAQHAQASIRERQALTQIANSEETIRLQVRTAARAIRNGIETVRAAQNARDLADRQYRAELRRFEVGTSSNFQVLQLQRLLTGSRSREVQAVSLFNIALANFERVRGTLLESLSVSVAPATEPSP